MPPPVAGGLGGLAPLVSPSLPVPGMPPPIAPAPLSLSGSAVAGTAVVSCVAAAVLVVVRVHLAPLVGRLPFVLCVEHGWAFAPPSKMTAAAMLASSIVERIAGRASVSAWVVC